MTALKVLSSMATRSLLTDALQAYAHRGGPSVDLLSIGGVDAQKRLRAGEAFDIAILARDALETLERDGFILRGSLRDLALSPTALAVPIGAQAPSNCRDDTVRDFVLSPPKTIAISTGPSGQAVRRLLDQWRFQERGGHLIEAPPGVPVARLLADGQAHVGFQQLSELLGQPGIDIVGNISGVLLPITTFTAGVCMQRRAPEDAIQALVTYLCGQETANNIRTHGMSAVAV